MLGPLQVVQEACNKRGGSSGSGRKDDEVIM